MGEGFLGRCSEPSPPAKGLGERCKLHQWGSGQSHDLLRALKTRLVAVNVGCSLFFLLNTDGPAEPFHTSGGILRFRRTLVEKH